jgi:hypothetical protein
MAYLIMAGGTFADETLITQVPTVLQQVGTNYLVGCWEQPEEHVLVPLVGLMWPITRHVNGKVLIYP